MALDAPTHQEDVELLSANFDDALAKLNDAVPQKFSYTVPGATASFLLAYATSEVGKKINVVLSFDYKSRLFQKAAEITKGEDGMPTISDWTISEMTDLTHHAHTDPDIDKNDPNVQEANYNVPNPTLEEVLAIINN